MMTELNDTKAEAINKQDGEMIMNEVKESDVKDDEVKVVVAAKEAAMVQKNSPTQPKVNNTDTRYEERTLALADIQKDEMFRRRLKEDEANIEKLVGLYRDNMTAKKNGKNTPHKIELILVWYDPILLLPLLTLCQCLWDALDSIMHWLIGYVTRSNRDIFRWIVSAKGTFLLFPKK